MDTEQALSAFAALSQPTRLDVFRLLVAHEPEGMPAGEVARALDVPHNTLSTHLGILARAGLIAAERQSRLIIYRAQLRAVGDLASFILKDCCGGKPEICAPLIADLQPCCPAEVQPVETIAAKEASHV
ncbi:ArsR family transcriptional regulator [Ancylobacter aquaticus]|uniref:ArsR family transcriptional regulator n=1 Tax=Ancylobacter aquaticus TaxID=100 RepID=A0A4R1I690_ANCAQ|nr:metalloregulator ArsR/SmtB family transcription factor [Ancylobacter aquaticus]TCK30884.1 ArsR family transcriptional regulator [Ancylobacter aquaticus]